MLSEEKFIDNKKNAFESYQTRIKELEDALNKILNECVPGVAGYYVIEMIVKEVLNESR